MRSTNPLVFNLAALIGSVILCVGAQASTVSHYALTGVISVIATSSSVTDPVPEFYDGSAVSENQILSNDSYAITSEESLVGERSGSAQSDIAAGRLSAATSAVNTANSRFTVTSVSLAEFGDGIVVADQSGAEYDWSSDDAVTFSFDLNGILLNDTIRSARSILSIALLEPGYLQTARNAALSPERDENDVLTINQRIIDQKTWTFGEGPIQNDCIFGLNGCDGNDIENLPGSAFNSQLSATFAPGQNFDVVIQLRVGSALSGFNDVPSSVFGDFVVDVAYEGPENSISYSASGVFPNTLSAVPLPGSAWLFATALCVLAVGRRNCNELR